MNNQAQALLYDRIASGQIPISKLDGEKTGEKFLALMQGAQVVRGDNVADYYFAHIKKKWNMEDEFPNLAMPYPTMWFEHVAPNDIGRCGLLVRAHEVESAAEIPQWLETLESGRDCKNIQKWWRESALPHRIEGSKRFHLLQMRPVVIATHNAHQVAAAPVTFYFVVTDQGQLATQGTACAFPSFIAARELPFEEKLGVAKDAMSSVIAPALMSVCFLHCKNVVLAPRDPDPKFAKAWQKRRGAALSRFHEINISPVQKVLEGEGSVRQNGFAHALHLCRGHFKHYTPQSGFMGRELKEPLTVWCPSHTRGNAENGTVSKRYKIGAIPEMATQ